MSASWAKRALSPIIRTKAASRTIRTTKGHVFDQVVAVDPASNAAMVDGTPLRHAFAQNSYANRVRQNGACCHMKRRGPVAHVEDIVQGYASNSEQLRLAGWIGTIWFD